jgi:hypothetical protein
VGIRTRFAAAATSALTCACVVLGIGFGTAAVTVPPAEARTDARRVTVQFFTALDHSRWSLACAMLARQFYEDNHVPDARHCVVGLRMGMSGWAVKFRIGKIEATGDGAVVHAVVDGAPGTVKLVREHGRLRVLALRAR